MEQEKIAANYQPIRELNLTIAKSPKYTNDSYNSTTKKQATRFKKKKKMGVRLKQTFLQRRHMDGQQACEKKAQHH